jgi:cyclophilin family peptidyl-prolyl cis-trans isomerase
MGLNFHRVIPDFMIQGGCPEGSGRGGPATVSRMKTNNGVRHDRGVLSMANAGPNTNGSQFFITHVPTPWLDGKHTVFGKVMEARTWSTSIKQGDTINSLKIEGDAAAVLAAKADRVASGTRPGPTRAVRTRGPGPARGGRRQRPRFGVGGKTVACHANSRRPLHGSCRGVSPSPQVPEVPAMPQLARRIGRAKPSAIMQVAEKAKRPQGRRPRHHQLLDRRAQLPARRARLCRRARALAKDSGQYGSNRGADALLDAFLQHIHKIGLDGYASVNVATGIGAKHVIYNLAEALADEGDTIAFRRRTGPAISTSPTSSTRRIDLLPCPASQDYKAHPAQLDAALAKKPKVFLFNNPSNPTGMVYSKEEDQRARPSRRQVSRHLGHHRRHLQPHGVRRRGLPQLRDAPSGTARPRDLHRLAVKDLRHAGLARWLHGRSRSGRAGDRDDELEPHHQHSGNRPPAAAVAALCGTAGRATQKNAEFQASATRSWR